MDHSYYHVLHHYALLVMVGQFHVQNPRFQRCLHRLKCCPLNLTNLQVVLRLLLHPGAFLPFWLKQKSKQNLR